MQFMTVVYNTAFRLIHMDLELLVTLINKQGVYQFHNFYKIVRDQVKDNLLLFQINYYVPEVKDGKYSQICPICLSTIECGVMGQPCKHQFCGNCILNYWTSRFKARLRCPICRQELRRFYRTYKLSIASSRTIKEMSNQILTYNRRFGNCGTELLMRIFAFPSHLRSFYSLVAQIYDFLKFIKNLFLVIWLTILIIYIISPIDLLPELFLGMVGLVDDLIAVLLVVIIVSTSGILHQIQ